jgi:hypothetical protein
MLTRSLAAALLALVAGGASAPSSSAAPSDPRPAIVSLAKGSAGTHRCGTVATYPRTARAKVGTKNVSCAVGRRIASRFYGGRVNALPPFRIEGFSCEKEIHDLVLHCRKGSKRIEAAPPAYFVLPR